MGDSLDKNSRERLLLLAAQYIDGFLDDSEVIELKNILNADAGNMYIFADYCYQNQMVQEVIGSNTMMKSDLIDIQVVEDVAYPLEESVSQDPVNWNEIADEVHLEEDELVRLDNINLNKTGRTRKQRRKSKIHNDSASNTRMIVIPKSMFYCAVAALFLFCVLLINQESGYKFLGEKNQNAVLPNCVAKLISHDGAVWEREGKNILNIAGVELYDGKYQLTEGQVSIKFNRGAEATITAPAEFSLLGSMLCKLNVGMLSAHIPPSAVGFRVDIPGGRVVDWGTDFTLVADKQGQSKAKVTNGEIEMAATDEYGKVLSVVRLEKDEIAKLDFDSKYVSKLTELPLEIPHSGKADNGRGVDKDWKVNAIVAGGLGRAYKSYIIRENLRGWNSEGDKSNWISPIAMRMNASDNAVFRFTTQFFIADDTDLDRIKIVAKLSCDDSLKNIRVNGKIVWSEPDLKNDSEPIDYGISHREFRNFDLAKGKYIVGMNNISFDIKNLGYEYNRDDKFENALGLRVEFEASAWQFPVKNDN